MLNNQSIEYTLLSLGANLGDRRVTLSNAVEALQRAEIIRDIVVSSWYETEPFGVSEQPNFLNIAISGYTQLNPQALLYACKGLEVILGRKPREHWHEREIDIDIIFCGNHIISTPELTLPHTQAKNRNFVLYPLAEIAPNFIDPSSMKSIIELRNTCTDTSKVIKLDY